MLYFQKNTPFSTGSVESVYRYMTKQYHNYHTSTEQTPCPKDITQDLSSCFQQLMDRRYDDKAITCIVKSLEDELEGTTEDFSDFISRISNMDDTWAFLSSGIACHMFYCSLA